MASSLLLLDAIIQREPLNDHLPQNPPSAGERKRYTHKASESVAQLEIDFDLKLCDSSELVGEGVALFQRARDAGHFIGTDFGQTQRPPKDSAFVIHNEDMLTKWLYKDVFAGVVSGYQETRTYQATRTTVNKPAVKIYKRHTDVQTLCEHTRTVVAKAQRNCPKRSVLAGQNFKYTFRCDMEIRKGTQPGKTIDDEKSKVVLNIEFKQPYVIPMEAWIQSAQQDDGELGAGKKILGGKNTAARTRTIAIPSADEQPAIIAHDYTAGNYQINDLSNPDVYLDIDETNTRAT
ncbi:hypothetical protein CABS01_05573 [Colletotrichum abscissum]|uniref:Uncharacterized protein n=1 Tax=Colletotrichum abscissum TaxID=1671311 RepID=A0A9Q0AY29_9PEZI|nr:uncharacterized protein CABS01_05573 [Colletotrichum abscissum]KAI3534333.1 hypothetical protein CABS02_13289 [Colletotrichum abscissum]KAK1521068.1 hypothetical protein CABS01_05573 [Colletotrichum abscissum]